MAAAWGWTTNIVDKPAALGALRRSLRLWLERLELSENLDELILIASELTTNAIEASKAPSDPVTVRVRIEPYLLVVMAANIGPRFALPSPLPGDQSAATGRGLFIVQSLAEHVRVARDGDQVVVSAWRPLRPPGQTSDNY